MPTDVTVEAQVVKLFATTMDSFNSVDVLVNNAGTFDGGPLEDIKLETWKKVVEVSKKSAARQFGLESFVHSRTSHSSRFIKTEANAVHASPSP